MKIERPIYLQKLIDRKDNGMVKIITGMRRCGKSYLLFNLFADYLKSEGTDEQHIIAIDLENMYNERLREPLTLLQHIDEQVRKLSFRIVDEAKEYMKLYERTYYEEVIKMCQEKIDTIEALKELSRKYSEK